VERIIELTWHHPAPMSQSPDTQQAILFLAANPDGLRRVGQELRLIPKISLTSFLRSPRLTASTDF